MTGRREPTPKRTCKNCGAQVVEVADDVGWWDNNDSVNCPGSDPRLLHNPIRRDQYQAKGGRS